MRRTPGTILLVDDEVSVRDSMRSALEGCGYTVLDAASYESAMRTFQEHLADIALLVTDIALPGDNGYELAAQISAVRPNIKVIFVSGQAGTEVCKFYYMPETDPRLLKKPFAMDELLRRVHAALGPRGSELSHASGG